MEEGEVPFGPEAKRHPIQVAATRTGLTKDVLRVWERRYGLVEPGRTSNGRRLYSDTDVERLRLVRQASESGRSLARLARMSDTELARLVAEDQHARDLAVEESGPAESPEVAVLRGRAIAAIESLDAAGLRLTLDHAITTLQPRVLIEDLIAPLMRRIGRLWAEGELQPRHEHVASAAIRAALDRLTAVLTASNSGGPVLVCSTPAGQRHEIGALLVAATAAAAGWNVVYLGPDLPADEIADAARLVGARAVALSLVYPSDDPAITGVLTDLRGALAAGTALLVGGRSADAYASTLESVGALRFDDLAQLRHYLSAAAG